MSAATIETSPNLQELEIEHDRVVREEIDIFRSRSQAYLAGDITEISSAPFALSTASTANGRPASRWCAARFPAAC